MASGDARLSRSEPPECRNSLWKYRISWRTRRLGNGRASLTLAFLQAPERGLRCDRSSIPLAQSLPQRIRALAGVVLSCAARWSALLSRYWQAD
jgi:hypothetical protein